MASLSTSWIFEKPFIFLVGPDREKAQIHPSLINSEQYGGLHVLVNGPFNEAQAQEAKLPDVDVFTFERFAQYVYTGSYQLDKSGAVPSEHRSSADEPTTTPQSAYEELFYGLKHYYCQHCLKYVQCTQPTQFPSCLECVNIGNRVGTFCVGCGKTTRGAVLCLDCKQLQHSRPASTIHPSGPSSLTLRRGATSSFIELKQSLCGSNGTEHIINEATRNPSTELIEHAKVYVFADKWRITNLCKYALLKLHADLCKLDLTKGNMPKLVHLLDYAWEYTVDGAGDDGEPMTLRGLLMAYVFDVIEHLRDHPEFTKLIEGNADFAQSAFLRLVVKKVKLG